MSSAASETLPDAGVSIDTHNQIKDENAQLREQLANMKARQQVYEERQREQIVGIKDDVNTFVNTIAKENPQHTELGMMCRWAAKMDEGDALETNLGIGRLISCASANLKRHREEASTLQEKSTALADANRKIQDIEAERDAKANRVAELEGLVSERTAALEKLQKALADQGALTETFNFSNPSAREAGASSSGAGSSSDAAAPAASSSAPAPNMDDALFAFVSKGGRGSLRIGQSGTSHHILGSSGENSLASALRF